MKCKIRPLRGRSWRGGMRKIRTISDFICARSVLYLRVHRTKSVPYPRVHRAISPRTSRVHRTSWELSDQTALPSTSLGLRQCSLTTDRRLKRCSLNCLSSRKVLNGKPHGWDSTAERLIRDNLTSRVDQETPRYAFESSRAHGSIVGEKHTAVYQ